MSRSSQLAKLTELAPIVAALRTSTDNLRLAIQKVGASNLIILLTKNGTDWDVSTTVVAFAIKKYRVTFTFDDSVNAYAELLSDFTVSGVSNGNFKFAYYDDPENVNDGSKKSWIVTIENYHFSTTLSFNFKAIVNCADTGTLEVDLI